MEFLEALREGRVVVLPEPRKKLVWGDKDHDTVLCPECKSDLMGGFKIESRHEMFQCPYCGCPVDVTGAVECLATENFEIDGGAY